jgi:hypothetical protein
MEPDKNTTPASPSDDVKPSINPSVPGSSVAPDTSAATPGVVTPAGASSTPPVSPSATPAGVPPTLPPKPRKKGLVAALIAAGAVLVLAGGSAAAYFGYYVPNKPENVLKAAIVNSFDTNKTKTINFEGELNAEDSESDMNIGVDFKGAAGENCNFDLHADIDAMVTKLTLDMRSVDGKDYYLKVGGLEGLPELLNTFGDSSADAAAIAQVYSPLIASINNQWYMLNESLIKEAVGSETTCSHYSEEDISKVGQAYENNQFLSVQKALADEKIKNVDSHHYKVAIDGAKAKGFMAAIKNANLKELKISDEQLKEFNKLVESGEDNKQPLDVWISKESKLINQLAYSYTEKTTTLDMRFTVTDVNKEVKVEKPEGAKSVMELLSSFLGEGGLNALTGTPGLEQSSDVDAMMRELESGISL